MGTISILKITKGNNSAKNVGGVTFVNLCTSAKNVGGVTFVNLCTRLVMLYISTKFCDIISNGIKIIERTRFLY